MMMMSAIHRGVRFRRLLSYGDAGHRQGKRARCSSQGCEGTKMCEQTAGIQGSMIFAIWQSIEHSVGESR